MDSDKKKMENRRPDTHKADSSELSDLPLEKMDFDIVKKVLSDYIERKTLLQRRRRGQENPKMRRFWNWSSNLWKTV